MVTTREFLEQYQRTLLSHTQSYFSGKRVLDVGCGNGIAAQIISEQTGARMHLCDIVDIRSQELKSKFPFVKCGAHSLQFEENAFDTLYLQFVLHHIKLSDVASVAQELFRVSKEYAILIEEIRTAKTCLDDALKNDEQVNQFIHPGVDMPVYKYYTCDEVKKLFGASKLVEQKLVISGTKQNGFIDTYLFVFRK